jgi:ketosteroid isomerase-like protein
VSVTVGTDPIAVVERLQAAINAHDLEALVGCFAPGYISEAPAHPARDFVGSDGVRRNWGQILAGVPDLRAQLIRSTIVGNTVWAEWDWTGTRRDGQPHHMAGVTIQGVEGDALAWVRFYMEPVEVSADSNEAAIARTAGGPSTRGES